MSEGVHWLVPFAACPSAGCREALRGLELPVLGGLLARLQPTATDAGQASDLSPPHERVLARAAGLWLGDGQVPEAAWQWAREGQDPGDQAWAWLTPCHWRVGRDHVRMDPPDLLALDEPSSRALLASMQPYFAEDGIEVRYRSPGRWLASGELFRGLACASLDRVAGATVDDWLPRSPQARPLRRLQQEMQMLLYTHAVNDSREARGLAPVNSFWVSGAGALPPGSDPLAPVPQVQAALRAPALAGDWPQWAARWRELDAGWLPPLRAALERGETLSLTLCGTASARTWTAGAGGWRQRLSRWIGRGPSPAQELESL